MKTAESYTHTHTHTHTCKRLMAPGAAALTLLLTFPIFAQTSDSKIGTATATVIAPLSVTNTGNMNWGFLVPNQGDDFPGEIDMIMNSSGQIVQTAFGSHAGGTVTPAKARITGSPGSAVSIPWVTATLRNGAKTMNVDIDGWSESSTIPANGILDISSGGWLTGGNLTPGTYTGTYTIVVSYE